MARYGLATIFEEHAVGYEFTSADLPLHLTHIDSFETEMKPSELINKLSVLLENQRALTVTAVADKMYGPNKDIPVTELELTLELKTLHDTLVGFLSDEGIVLRNPQFNGSNFTPHVSVYGEKRVAVGQDVVISDVSLATKVSDAEDANRRVLANFMLS